MLLSSAEMAKHVLGCFPWLQLTSQNIFYICPFPFVVFTVDCHRWDWAEAFFRAFLVPGDATV
jgi:hypothetical protein